MISFDFKYPSLKFNLLEVLHASFVEITGRNLAENTSVTNAILYFFSELNSVFLLQTLGPTLSQLLEKGREGEGNQVELLWGFNGMKVN